MAIIQGTVEGVSIKWEKYSILVNGTWYSTKLEWATCKPNKGDEVSFDDGGSKFTKNMKILGEGTGAPAASSGGSVTAVASKSSYSRGSFPIALEDGQRSIIRQNALTNARELVGRTITGDTGFEPEVTVDLIIEIARQFEAFTAGDIDRYEAEASKEEVKDAFAA